MTAARFRQLKAGAIPASPEEASELANLLQWERRSASAKQAVQTKRRKYTKWPTRLNNHKERGK